MTIVELPTKKETKEKILFFKTNTHKKLKNKKTIDDLKNQLYFRELIVKAHLKKFKCLPDYRNSHAQEFEYESSESFYEVLKGKFKLKLVSALIATDILGIEFKPPQETTNLGLMSYESILTGNKKADDKYIEIILEYFNNQSEINLEKRISHISKENIENQRYFRELIIKAFLKEFNTLPLGNTPKRDHQAKEFGYTTLDQMSNAATLRLESNISVLAALIASKVLGVEFKPPHRIILKETNKEALALYSEHDFRDEYLEYILNYFNEMAESHHQTYGTPRFPATEKYFRELIVRAFIEKYNMVPRADLNAKYCKPFGYSHFGGFFASLLNQRNLTIHLESVSKATEILGSKLEIPDKDYSPSFPANGDIFLGKENEFLGFALNEYHRRAKKNYEDYDRPYDHRNQDYYRDLILRAFVKLNKSMPRSSTPLKQVAHFTHVNARNFYRKIVYYKADRIDAEIALRAADILGVNFDPPQYKYYKEEINEIRKSLKLKELTSLNI